MSLKQVNGPDEKTNPLIEFKGFKELKRLLGQLIY